MLDLQPDVAIRVLIGAFITINLKPIATKIEEESGLKVQKRPKDVAHIPGKYSKLYNIFFFTS